MDLTAPSATAAQLGTRCVAVSFQVPPSTMFYSYSCGLFWLWSQVVGSKRWFQQLVDWCLWVQQCFKVECCTRVSLLCACAMFHSQLTLHASLPVPR